MCTNLFSEIQAFQLESSAVKKLAPFALYDLFRLSAFGNRKTEIKTYLDQNFLAFLFPEVDYFNYVYFFSNWASEKTLIDILKNYQNYGRSTVKFIIPKNLDPKIPVTFLSENPPKTISCLQNTEPEIPENPVDFELKPVISSEELADYTRLYLQCFESKKTNYKEVAANFYLLLNASETDLFFIYYKNKRVGFCSSFYTPQYCLLSACGISAENRYLGFQKQAIYERLRIASFKGFTNFKVWTYKDSISYSNLLKTGFKTEYEHHEYLSRPLEDLTKSTHFL
ncbi:hypothetical protein [Leeuwenhoekiella parthenopeia]|uniref:N-acetyltransferase domain-containing protein n=1 Tax=Leeuwenhoekiella parthenopeia TaxID=2890320 RepID=A0ABS8GXT5_9FLAO|nr:hypothetical protein [Leeuwenhoekiella parthenopeia]MCC4213916.1 hypothetical protein [Leeuwenhoekiella parthenopeia]